MVGAGLALLTLIDLPSFEDQENSAINTYLYTPWILPTVVLRYEMVVLVDDLLTNYIHKAVMKKRHNPYVNV